MSIFDTCMHYFVSTKLIKIFQCHLLWMNRLREENYRIISKILRVRAACTLGHSLLYHLPSPTHTPSVPKRALSSCRLNASFSMETSLQAPSGLQYYRPQLSLHLTPHPNDLFSVSLWKLLSLFTVSAFSRP